jgi:hypothetical protein
MTAITTKHVHTEVAGCEGVSKAALTAGAETERLPE